MANRLPSSPPQVAGFSYVRPLGTGGFADVFLFEQNMPKRQVAVKVLLSDVVDPDVLRMFNAEADIMAKLSAHPSILTVYDASVSSDGRPFLVMEFCPTSLGRTYRRTPLSVQDVLNIGVKMASALETAHRAGVLHRDIKPSNILTTTFGSPVLSDFGIATSLSGDSQRQLFAMSVPWSAPEVVDEVTLGTVASEVWSLGATLYSLLAGHTPFEVMDSSKNSREDIKARIRRASYQRINRGDVPESLDALLRRALQKKPSDRPVSMLEVAQSLQAIQVEQGQQPSLLEVTVDEWAARGSAIDFDNTSVRGAVISEVQIETSRSKRQKNWRTGQLSNSEDAFESPSKTGLTNSPVFVTSLIIGGAVVGLGILVALIFAWGVI